MSDAPNKPERLYVGQDHERQIWDRDKPYAAFLAYCDLGSERSLAKVAAQLGKSKQLIERWSAMFEWVKRVRSYDAERRREWVSTLDDERVRRAQRTLRRIDRMGILVDRAIEGAEKDPSAVAADPARMMEMLAKLERLVLGESTLNTSVSSADAREMSVEEMQAMLAAADGESAGERDE